MNTRSSPVNDKTVFFPFTGILCFVVSSKSNITATLQVWTSRGRSTITGPSHCTLYVIASGAHFPAAVAATLLALVRQLAPVGASFTATVSFIHVSGETVLQCGQCVASVSLHVLVVVINPVEGSKLVFKVPNCKNNPDDHGTKLKN